MSQLKLGIMTLYLNNRKQIEEKSYLRRLLTESRNLGIEAFLFTPEDVDHTNARILAIHYDPGRGRWKKAWTDFPDMIFDRCRFQPTERFKQLNEFRSRYPQLHYLNRPLSNKWRIHQLFSQNPLIKHHLPDTKLFKNGSGLLRFIAKHRVVFLKPVNGTGGRGILRISKLDNHSYLIQGRDNERRIITEQTLGTRSLLRKAYAWAGSRNYLMQQGIDIFLRNGRVHDFRLLIQKNGSGKWEVTGCAGRVGAARSITSNLHGGGRAVEMEKLLRMRFDRDALIQSIREEAETLSKDIVNQLEEEYGRLCELALDLAVDRDGRVWLIEINPKPGRNIFLQVHDPETYRTAVVRPLEYARWLYKQLKK